MPEYSASTESANPLFVAHPLQTRVRPHWIVLLGVLLLEGCQSIGPRPSVHMAGVHGHKMLEAPVEEAILDLRLKTDIDSLLPELLQTRVVFVGESHTSMAHHAKQLEVIKKLHQADPKLAIGMEMFQQPFQSHLDHFIHGEISQAEMLRSTEWYQRWGFDYPLYKPIMQFAAENSIPVIALNIPKESISRIREVGMQGLSDTQRATLPDQMEPADKAYTRRLLSVFHQHPGSEKRDFDRFIEIQLAWDEGMADRAARFLNENPDHRMVILAGSGHLAYGSGIPDRLERRLNDEATLTLLPADHQKIKPGIADFLIFTNPVSPPPSPRMGVLLNDTQAGLSIGEVISGSPAEQAGIVAGDIILAMDDQPISNTADLKIQLLDLQPGDKVRLNIRRKGFFGGLKELQSTITLGGST